MAYMWFLALIELIIAGAGNYLHLLTNEMIIDLKQLDI